MTSEQFLDDVPIKEELKKKLIEEWKQISVLLSNYEAMVVLLKARKSVLDIVLNKDGTK